MMMMMMDYLRLIYGCKMVVPYLVGFFSVIPAFNGDAYLLSVDALPSPLPEEGRYQYQLWLS